MPSISRWYIRTSLLYLVASLLVGVPIAFRLTHSLPPIIGALGPVYFHLFLVGWLMQLIFGVIFWLFPRPGSDDRQWEQVAWIAWALLNGGLILRAAAEPYFMLRSDSFWGWALVLSAVMQWLAGMGLIFIVWPRAYSRRQRRR